MSSFNSKLHGALINPLYKGMLEFRRRGGGSFDLSSLFGASDQGGIYDYTVMSRLSQDSTGATPVTIEGEYIGKIADPAKGNDATQATSGSRGVLGGMPRQLGTEQAVNGRFTSDTGWTKGAGWSIASGKATKTAGAASVLSQAESFTAGQFYVIFYSVLRTAGSVVARLTGGTTVTGVSRTAAGSYYDLIRADTGNTTLEFSADASFAGSVYSVSIKPVSQFVNRMMMLDGTDDRMQTASIDMSASDKATLIVVSQYGQALASMIFAEFGNYYSNASGSFAAAFNSRPNGLLRGDSSQVSVSTVSLYEGASNCPMLHVNIMEFDLAQSATADEIQLEARGILPAVSATGTESGGGNLANGQFTLGAAYNYFQFWNGGICRALLINRLLSPDEKTAARKAMKQGMAYCAVLGDSTVAINDSSVGMTNTFNVASLAGGMIVGAADVSLAGDKIANQKTKWTALPGKTALEAVIIQVGLNDINAYIGVSKTTAQIIADLQDLVDTVNADKPSGCKTYICGLTPCKGWLGAGGGRQATCYQSWLDVNEAIAGGGATPITGVDGRITSHIAALNDGSGNLLAIYDHNSDGVHPSNEARFIIAQAWRSQLEADGLVS